MVPQQNANVENFNIIAAGPAPDVVFGAVAKNATSLGWSVFPQDSATRKPSSVSGRVIRPKTEFHVDERIIDAATLETWCMYASTSSVACMFGAWAPGLFALDVDILDQAMADQVGEIADEHLGETPLVRVGRAPKFMAFFRTPAGSILPSQTLRIAAEDGSDSGHAVEIQSVGKTVTLHGRHHKTGEYYRWVGKATPLLYSPDTAPEVGVDQVNAFIAALSEAFPLVKASRFASEAQWAEGDAGRVRRVSVVLADGEAKAKDGREQLLRDIVWRTCTANGQAFVLANSAESMDSLVRDVAKAVETAFSEVAECNGRWAPASLRAQAEAGVRRLGKRIFERDVEPRADQGAAVDANGNAVELPVIRMLAGDIAGVVDRAEDALAKSARSVFQRSGDIVQIGFTPVMSASGKEVSNRRIYSVGRHALTEHLSVVATYESFDARSGAYKVAKPPAWIAETLMERTGRMQLPVLNAVVSCPTMRADGSILDKEGYDADTGLLLDFEGITFPAIPEKPTLEDAQVGLEKLCSLIQYFSPVTPAHKSVILAMFLTAVVRNSLRSAPVFGISAVSAGSGKSKLVDIASVLATGREVGVIQQGKSEEEDEKRIGSLLLSGATILALDNCNKPIDGDLLCQMMTQATVRPRILGKSEAPELSTNMLVTATGNRLVFQGDMTRRSLIAKLDPGCPHPEDRTFEWDPVEEAKRLRPELVVAALTVMRAYKAAGSPRNCAPLGSFEPWCRVVRDALVWAGYADAVETMQEVRDNDPVVEQFTAVTTQWRMFFGPGVITARQLIECATELKASNDGLNRTVFVRPDFREALLSVAELGGNINSKRLGRWLMTAHSRPVDGCKIIKCSRVHGVQEWRMELDERGQRDWAEVQHRERVVTDFQFMAMERFGSDVIGENRQATWMKTPRTELGGLDPLTACRDLDAYPACLELLAQVERHGAIGRVVNRGNPHLTN